MVKIIDFNGRTVYAAPDAVASITEAGASSQWHGIRSIVKLFDGRVIEAQEEAGRLAAAVDAARAAAAGI